MALFKDRQEYLETCRDYHDQNYLQHELSIRSRRRRQTANRRDREEMMDSLGMRLMAGGGQPAAKNSIEARIFKA